VVAKTNRRRFTAAHLAAGLKQRAVCGCGHVGRSANPKLYQCGCCYYLNWAIGELNAVSRALDRVDKLLASAVRHRDQATAFRARHPVSTKKLPAGTQAQRAAHATGKWCTQHGGISRYLDGENRRRCLACDKTA
jgi:hypothetical protein